ncbi:MAG TPA: hypothetical protein VHE99_08310 [Gammaproteobacteria bacterium]|nr:hypothetical protein [Gammaproteobacteria bacterium]
MKTKLHLLKSILITLLGCLAATSIANPAQAEICPLVETIVSSNPDSTDYATYFSPQMPGWHSHHVPMVDLSDAKFDSVMANNYRVDCVYDTPEGYLVLHPDDHQVIDISTVINNGKWYCNASQSERYPDRTEEDCTCTESIDICGFTLLPAPYAPYPYS